MWLIFVGVKVQSKVRNRSIISYFKPSSDDRLLTRNSFIRRGFAGRSSMNSHPQAKGRKMINIFHRSSRESEDVHRRSSKSKGEHVLKNLYKRSSLAASRQSRDPIRLQEEAQVCSSEGLKPSTLTSSRGMKDSTLKKPGSHGGSGELLSSTSDSEKEHTSILRSSTSGEVPGSPTSRGSKSMSTGKELNFNSLESRIAPLASSPHSHGTPSVVYRTNSGQLFIPSDLSRCPIDAVRSKKGVTRSHEGTKLLEGGKIIGTLPVHTKSPRKPAPLPLLSPGKRAPVVSDSFQSAVTPPPSPVKRLPGNSPEKEQRNPPLSPLLLAKKSPVLSCSESSPKPNGPPEAFQFAKKESPTAPNGGPLSPQLAGKKLLGTSSNPSSPALVGKSASQKMALNHPSPLRNRRKSKDKSSSHRKRSVDERTKSPGELSSPLPSKKVCTDGCVSSSQLLGKKPSSPLQQEPTDHVPPMPPRTSTKPSPVSDSTSSRGKKLVQKSLKDYPSTPGGKDGRPSSSPQPSNSHPIKSSGKSSPGNKSPDEGQMSSRKRKQSLTLDEGLPSLPSGSHEKSSNRDELTSPLPSEKLVPSGPSTPKSSAALSSVFKKSPRSPLSLNRSQQGRGRTITYEPIIKLPKIPSPILKGLRSKSATPEKSASPVSEYEESIHSTVVAKKVKREVVEAETEVVKTEKTESIETATLHREGVVTVQEARPEQKVKVERCDLDSNSEPCLGQFPEAVLPRKRKTSDKAHSKKKKQWARKDSSSDIINLDSPSALELSKSDYVSLLDSPFKRSHVVDLTQSSTSPSSLGSVIDLTMISDNDSESFESPDTPSLRDPDLTPELTTRLKLFPTTALSSKSASSAPRKSVFMRRKTLFQFPSPSEKEPTPPLDKDLVTPTLPVFDEETTGSTTCSDDGTGSVANSDGVAGGVGASPEGSKDFDGSAGGFEDAIESVVPGEVEHSSKSSSPTGEEMGGAMDMDNIDAKDLAESNQLDIRCEEYMVTITKMENTRLDSLQQEEGPYDHLKAEEPLLEDHLREEDPLKHLLKVQDSIKCILSRALRPSPPPPPAVDRTQPRWKTTPITEVSTMMSTRGIECTKVWGVEELKGKPHC